MYTCLLPNRNALVAVSKGMRAVNLCTFGKNKFTNIQLSSRFETAQTVDFNYCIVYQSKCFTVARIAELLRRHSKVTELC